MRYAALLLLLLADVWMGLTVVHALSDGVTGEDSGGVFWTAAVILTLLLAALLQLTWRLGRRIARGADRRYPSAPSGP